MPYFIKVGFWEKLQKAPVKWLNLNEIIQSLITSPAWGSIDGTLSNQTDLNTVLEEKQKSTNTTTALVDGATMALTAIKHSLSTSSATRTFTISYTGDDISLVVILNTTDSIFTFPTGSLCVSEGEASTNNTCTLSGATGDKYLIAIKNIGGSYYIVCKNFGQ